MTYYDRTAQLHPAITIFHTSADYRSLLQKNPINTSASRHNEIKSKSALIVYGVASDSRID